MRLMIKLTLIGIFAISIILMIDLYTSSTFHLPGCPGEDRERLMNVTENYLETKYPSKNYTIVYGIHGFQTAGCRDMVATYKVNAVVDNQTIPLKLKHVHRGGIDEITVSEWGEVELTIRWSVFAVVGIICLLFTVWIYDKVKKK